MMNVVFGTPVRLLRTGQELRSGHAEGTRFQEWNLGRAIAHILLQPEYDRHLFEIETEFDWIDHLTAQRLAESSLFKRWRAVNVEQ